MANLRIVHDNAVKRMTLSASSQAGSLSVDRLKSNIKTRVWRATSTVATLTAVFDQGAEPVECVALPFCNFSSSATIRVRGYANASDPVPSFDTGHQIGCPYIAFDDFDWGVEPLGVNAFSYAAASQCVIWFPLSIVKKLVIDLSDPTSESGYLEAACLVVGTYWTPRMNMGWGASVTMQENTKNERSESGVLRSDRGTRARKLSFDLKYMDNADRSKLWSIMANNGMTSPAFFSLFPESDDTIEEQMHQVYGKMSQQTKIALQSFRSSQSQFEVEEV
jgi:hypothetical protein